MYSTNILCHSLDTVTLGHWNWLNKILPKESINFSNVNNFIKFRSQFIMKGQCKGLCKIRVDDNEMLLHIQRNDVTNFDYIFVYNSHCTRLNY